MIFSSFSSPKIHSNNLFVHYQSVTILSFLNIIYQNTLQNNSKLSFYPIFSLLKPIKININHLSIHFFHPKETNTAKTYAVPLSSFILSSNNNHKHIFFFFLSKNHPLNHLTLYLLLLLLFLPFYTVNVVVDDPTF